MGLGSNAVVTSPNLDDLRDAVWTFRRAAEGAGRDPSSLPVVVWVNGSITAKAPGVDRFPLTGSVPQVVDDFAELDAMTVDEVLWLMDTEPEEQLLALELLLAQLGP